MDGGRAVGKQVFALGGAPFDAYLVYFFVVFAFPHFLHQFLREVDAERSRQHFDVGLGGNGFQAGDDGRGDSCRPAFFDESVEFAVVEEHLGDDVVGAGIYFPFQVFDVDVDVRGFVVFFRIGGNTDAEVGMHGVGQCFVQVDSLVHIVNLFDQFVAVPVSVGFRGKVFLSGNGVAAQCHNVLDVQEIQVD